MYIQTIEIIASAKYFMTDRVTIQIWKRLSKNQYIINTEIIDNEGITDTRVCRKKIKLPVLQIPNLPKTYKFNIIKGNLHRPKRIATNSVQKVPRIRNIRLFRKHIAVCCSVGFLNSIVIVR